jgi:hypothetical protein
VNVDLDVRHVIAGQVRRRRLDDQITHAVAADRRGLHVGIQAGRRWQRTTLGVAHVPRAAGTTGEHADDDELHTLCIGHSDGVGQGGALNPLQACAIVGEMWRTCLLLLVVASGCHIAFPIEPEADAGGRPPRVYSSPGPAAMIYGGYPKSFAITLAADEPGTTIYYTTDGSMPDETSTMTNSAVTPIPGITISTTTMVRYFGISTGGRGELTSESFSISATTPQSNAGYLVTNATLDGTSPTVIASKGATLAARANVQAWVQFDCPGCRAQVVYGVDQSDQGCLYDDVPGVYPGVAVNGKMFNVKVPTTSGVHEVRLAHIEQTSCAAAIAAKALSTRPTIARIGVIVVP